MDIDKNIDFDTIFNIIDRNFNKSLDFDFEFSNIESFLKLQTLRNNIKQEIFMEVYKKNGMC